MEKMKRRSFRIRSCVFWIVVASMMTLVESSVELVENWPANDSPILGHVAGVAVKSNGDVVVFHRGSRSLDFRYLYPQNGFTNKSPIEEHTVVHFNSDGQVIGRWGQDMFYIPQGLATDAEDNIWLTDVALHQVMKFEPGSTRPSLTLGTRFEPGSSNTELCKPTDVAVLSNGDFFVTDGYYNSRVLEYDASGEYRFEIEQGGTDPPGFLILHSITALEDRNEICVADQENYRVLCFDITTRHYLRQLSPWKPKQRVIAVSYSNGRLYVLTDSKLLAVGQGKGYTLDPQSGTILETWAPPEGFTEPHDLQVNPAGDALYVGQFGGHKKLFKFFIY